MRQQPTSFRLPQDVVAALRSEYERTGITQSDFVRDAIAEKFERASVLEGLRAELQPLAITLNMIHGKISKLTEMDHQTITRLDMFVKLFLRYVAEPTGQEAVRALATLEDRMQLYDRAVAAACGTATAKTQTNGRGN